MTARAFLSMTAVAVLLIAAWSPVDCAQASPPSEYQIKAAFLYNFAKFVEWPAKSFADSRSPIVIGILGDDPFGRALDQVVEGKTVNGRQLAVKRFSRVRDAASCHILFISSSESGSLSSILEELKGARVLTVGETERFMERGGIVNFKVEQRRVCFEVNMEAARQAGLKISSKMLKVADVVKG